ncbi:hypothetical protein BJX68DRAFT_56392 [Aspergillus pseudodeflectus]|uniref:Uncharacterized protein n=1 Tax=Aspergillus pseudodeflectus TaxID=176178 RepID=A0ABR4KLH7_9EURO
MCFYQPNTAGCTCAFLQLIQPCQSPNVQYYPSPNPTANPKPIVRVCNERFIAKGVGQRVCPKCAAQSQKQVPSQYQAQRRFSTAGSSLAMGAAVAGVVGQSAIIGNNGVSGSVAWSNVNFSQASPGSDSRPGSGSSVSPAATTLPSGKRRGESLSRALGAKRVSLSGLSFSPSSETTPAPASSSTSRSRSSSPSSAPSAKLGLPATSTPPSLGMAETVLAPIPEIGGLDNVLKTEVGQDEQGKYLDSAKAAEEGLGEMMSLLLSPKATFTPIPTPVEQGPVKNEEGNANCAGHVTGRPRGDSLFDDLDLDGGANQVADTEADTKIVKGERQKEGDFPELSPIGQHDLWTMENDLKNEPVVQKVDTEHE